MAQEIPHRDEVEQFAPMLMEEVEHVVPLISLETPQAGEFSVPAGGGLVARSFYDHSAAIVGIDSVVDKIRMGQQEINVGAVSNPKPRAGTERRA